jgi:probable rRNA maturation factor
VSGGLARRHRARRGPLHPSSPSPPPLALSDRQRAVKLPAVRIRRAVAAALALSGRRAGPLSIALVDDRTIQRLHRDHLDDDTPTDVLSFPLRSERGGLFGEVVASGETARREARARGHDPADELLLYVVHGVLHLLGFDDHGAVARKKMRAAERAALRAAGIRRDLFPSRS